MPAGASSLTHNATARGRAAAAAGLRFDRYARLAMVSAAVGALAVLVVALVPRWNHDAVGWLNFEFCVTALVIVPLCLALCCHPAGDGPQPWLLRVAVAVQPVAAAAAVVAVFRPVGSTAAIALSVLWFACCAVAAAHGVVRFLRRGLAAPRELAVDLGLLYLPLAAFFFVSSRAGAHPFALPAEIVVLAGVHFVNAGTVALVLTTLAARWLARSRSPARFALVLSGLAGLVSPTLIAFGMTYRLTVLELGAAFMMEAGYVALAVVTLGFVVPRVGHRLASGLLAVSGVSLLGAMALAVGYSLRILSIAEMVPTHGLIQAFGFCTAGLVGYLALGPVTRDAALEVPVLRPAAEPLVVPPVFRTIDDVRDGLAQLEAQFLKRRDRRGVFATTYLTMFGDIQIRVPEGFFEDPVWFTRYAVALANRYRAALDDHEHRRAAPACWRIAFDASAAGHELVMQDLLLALNAHIAHDHTLALIDAGIADDRESRHRAYTAMNISLRGSIDQVQRRLAELYAPVDRVVDVVLGPLDEIVTRFGMERVRAEAWRAAVEIADAADPAARRRALEDCAAAEARAILRPSEAHPWMLRFLAPLEQLQGPADRPPPGNLGLPWIGESLAFAQSPVRFLYDRMQQYGPVFKTRVLGKRVVCLVGPEGLAQLANEDRFHRAGGPPTYWKELLCWRSSPLIDGAPRRTRKRMLLSAFSREAMADYVEIMERLVRAYAERWRLHKRFAWVPEMQMLSYAIAHALFTGVTPEVGDAGASATLDRFIAGFRALPIRLPFLRFGRALRAQRDLLATIEQAIAAHRTRPARDLMQRLLDARDPDGAALTDDELKIETLHLYFASYGGMSAVLTTLALILAQRPDVRERALREVMTVSPSGPVTLDQLDRLSYVDRVTREVRRYYPLVAATIFAEVREPFEFRGYRIPAGWNAIGCIHGSLHNGRTFIDPEHFDPDRFSQDRGEGRAPNTYVPHGAGAPDGHRCPGEGLTDVLMKLTTVVLLREFTWQLPPQNLELDLSADVALPRDGLIVVFERATEASRAAVNLVADLPPVDTRQEVCDALGVVELRLETARDRGVMFVAALRKVLRGLPAGDDVLERMCVGLAQRYLAAVAGYRGLADTAPKCWQLALESAAAGTSLLIQDLLLALNAHLNYDLPNVLAEVALDRAGAPEAGLDCAVGRAAVRQKLDTLCGVIRDAVAPIEDRLTSFYGPALRAFDRVLGAELTTFSMAKACDAAWTAALALRAARTTDERAQLRAQLDDRVTIHARLISHAESGHGALFHALRMLERLSPRFLPALDADEAAAAHPASEPVLVASLDAIIARLDQLIAGYDGDGSRLSIYPTVYVDITHRLIAKLAQPGYFADGGWVEGVDRNFASEYLRVIDNHTAGRHDQIPRCWQIVLEAAATKQILVFQDLLLAIAARLIRDMPIALYRAGFAAGDVAQHRSDFGRLHEIFGESLEPAKRTLNAKYSHVFGVLDTLGAHLDNLLIVHEFEAAQATAMEVALAIAAAPSEAARQAIMAELDHKACDVIHAILLRGVPGGGWIIDALRAIESRFSGAWSGWIREQGPT